MPSPLLCRISYCPVRKQISTCTTLSSALPLARTRLSSRASLCGSRIERSYPGTFLDMKKVRRQTQQHASHREVAIQFRFKQCVIKVSALILIHSICRHIAESRVRYCFTCTPAHKLRTIIDLARVLAQPALQYGSELDRA